MVPVYNTEENVAEESATTSNVAKYKRNRKFCAFRKVEHPEFS